MSDHNLLSILDLRMSCVPISPIGTVHFRASTGATRTLHVKLIIKEDKL
jgi:hypothetical protein